MRRTLVALTLLAVASLVGCSQNTELQKARAEADAAKAELAQVKGELDQLKAQLAPKSAELAQLKGELDRLKTQSAPKSPDDSEEAVRKSVREFFGDLAKGFVRSAYDLTSLAYQKRTDLKSFEQFLAHHRALQVGAANLSDSPLFEGDTSSKVRRLAKGNAYECDMVTSAQDGISLVRINITLRLIEEEGRWKIDDFVEVKSSPK